MNIEDVYVGGDCAPKKNLSRSIHELNTPPPIVVTLGPENDVMAVQLENALSPSVVIAFVEISPRFIFMSDVQLLNVRAGSVLTAPKLTDVRAEHPLNVSVPIDVNAEPVNEEINTQPLKTLLPKVVIGFIKILARSSGPAVPKLLPIDVCLKSSSDSDVIVPKVIADVRFEHNLNAAVPIDERNDVPITVVREVHE